MENPGMSTSCLVKCWRNSKMEGEEKKVLLPLEEKVFSLFAEFMTRVAKFEELVTVGGEMLVGFHQGLELLRRPPINKTSELVDSIIKANDTKRVKAYIEAGSISVHDRVKNLSKLHTCQVGLRDCLSKEKYLLNELECLMGDAASVIRHAYEKASYWGNFATDELEYQETGYEKEEMESCCHQNSAVTDYTAMMGIVYSMMREDNRMQEKIVSSLNLNSSSGEMESYCMMWSLRPFINDETMHRAWKLIP